MKTKREIAKEAGFTKLINFASGEYDLDLLVKPDADLDGTFLAFDEDEGDYLRVNGWTGFVTEFNPYSGATS